MRYRYRFTKSGNGKRYWKHTYDCRQCHRTPYKRKLYRWLAERRHQKLIRWDKRFPERAGLRWKNYELSLDLCSECGHYPGGWFGTGKCKDCARRYARRLERKKITRNPELRKQKLAQLRQWKQDNWGRERARNRIANQQRRDPLDGNDLTKSEWKAILRAFDFTCVYCGERGGSKQKDHVIPFSKGGKFTLSNIVPACGPCNLERSNTDFREWLNDEQKYDVILQTVGDLEYNSAQ